LSVYVSAKKRHRISDDELDARIRNFYSSASEVRIAHVQSELHVGKRFFLFFFPAAHKSVSGNKRVKAAVQRVFGAVISSKATHITIPETAPLFFQQGRRDDYFRLTNLFKFISIAVIGSLVLRTTDAQITAYLTAHRDELDSLTDAAIARTLNIGCPMLYSVS
jgi:hypothetical protein